MQIYFDFRHNLQVDYIKNCDGVNWVESKEGIACDVDPAKK